MNRSKLENPIVFFENWAKIDKDEGMETGHADSVKFMFKKIFEKQRQTFNFLDVGCGNGWAVRKMSYEDMCNYSAGIDGSVSMIQKAKSKDKVSEYFCENLMNWTPNMKYDVVHSMEVFYYFNHPKEILSKIYDNWLCDNGFFIFGIDHYRENKLSLNWPEECGVFMKTHSINEWKEILLNVGFKNIDHWQVGQKDDWCGTLIFAANK